MNIYVGNLSYDATEETIRQAFESFGRITSARIIKDKYTGQSRGFGSVEMGEHAEPDGFHGGKFAVKRGKGKPWF